MDASLINVCNVVVESPVCKNIPRKNRLDCSRIEDTSQISAWDFMAGCGKGVFDSVASILDFSWGVMQWVWDNSTNSAVSGETIEKSREYSNSLNLYLHAEYEKAYQDSGSPLKHVKAIKAIGGSVSNLIINAITQILSTYYHELGCLNFETKSELMCEFVAQFVASPALFFSAIVKGTRIAGKVAESLSSLRLFKTLSKATISPKPSKHQESRQRSRRFPPSLPSSSSSPATTPPPEDYVFLSTILFRVNSELLRPRRCGTKIDGPSPRRVSLLSSPQLFPSPRPNCPSLPSPQHCTGGNG